jgi:tetratricopeptide (TPR) repeat protein
LPRYTSASIARPIWNRYARAIAVGIDGPPIDFIDALRLKRAGRNDDALVALERAGDVVSGAWREHLRGLMLDRLGRYDEAFEAFEAMNAFWRRSQRSHRPCGEIPRRRCRQHGDPDGGLGPHLDAVRSRAR